jgi:hypothetical protein
MKPPRRIIYCTPESNTRNVIMGDVGAFFIDLKRMFFHIKTPSGMTALSLNRLDDPHWDLVCNSRFPTLSPEITHGSWSGELKDGRLIEFNP